LGEYGLSRSFQADAGDVQVTPLVAVGELAEEHRARDRARLAAGRVLHVGDVAAQQLLVLGPRRQRPQPLAGALARLDDERGELDVVAHDAAALRAERDHHRAGQGRQVEHRVGLEPVRVRQRVGEHEAALGVGVVDLDRHAVGGGDDVARLDRASARHVLGRGDRGRRRGCPRA
jgi:hypothetical protein